MGDLERLRLEGIEDVDGDARDSAEERLDLRVLVEIEEAVSFRIQRPAVSRVGVPSELTDTVLIDRTNSRRR